MSWYLVTSPAGVVYGQHEARTQGETIHFPQYAQDQVLHTVGAAPLPLPAKVLSHAELVWADSTLAWQDTRTLPQAQAARLAAMRTARDAAIEGGFTWDGSVFDSDQTSQTRLLGAFVTGQGQTWRLANNTWRALSVADIAGVWTALTAHVQAQFSTFAVREVAILAATETTAVDAVQWSS